MDRRGFHHLGDATARGHDLVRADLGEAPQHLPRVELEPDTLESVDSGRLPSRQIKKVWLTSRVAPHSRRPKAPSP